MSKKEERVVFNCQVCGKQTETQRCWFKRAKNHFCSPECNLQFQWDRICLLMKPYQGAMEKSQNWKGGRINNGLGYMMIKMPNHPRADGQGYVLEHIVVAEQMLGRPLAKGEVVHHKDKNRANNLQENLQVFPSRAEHTLMHHRTKDVLNAG